MKKTVLSIFAMSTMFFISCGGEEKTEETATTENTTEEVVEEETGVSGTFNVAEGSQIQWHGRHYKDADYVHSGTVNVTEGSIVVENNNVVGGEFVFDMNQILEPGTDTTKQWTLEGHFKMPDFFNTASFPTATFSIASVADGNVTGTLSSIGVDQEITFPANITVDEAGVSVDANFELDLLPHHFPILDENEALPEEEKNEGPYPKAGIEFSLTATKAAM